MKKIILVACCTIATLAIKLDDVRATRRALVPSITTNPTQYRTANKFPLIGSTSDILIIILMKVRVLDSQYLHKVREKLSDICKQLQTLQRNSSTVQQLAIKGRCSEERVAQAFTQAIGIIKNIEGIIQKLLQTKNQLSSVLGLKMNLANTSTEHDLVGVLRMLSDSVIKEFQGIIGRFDKVPTLTNDQQVLNSYEQLKTLLVEYSGLLTQLDNGIKSLVNECIKTGININKAFHGMTLRELILGNSSTGNAQENDTRYGTPVRFERINDEDDQLEEQDDDEYSTPTNRRGNLNYNGNSRIQTGKQGSMNNRRSPRRNVQLQQSQQGSSRC